MSRKIFVTLIFILALLVSSSCQPWKTPATPEVNMPNPASVHCEQNGGKLEFRQDASGGTAGVCVFPDGSECDEWAFFRGECKPGDQPAGQITPSAASPEISGWKTYENNELGYSLEYPPDTTITPLDNPLDGFTITGPLVNGDQWPQIYFNHPRDREDYRPPEGVDLVQWLIDHSLISEERQPDTIIAGVQAVHLRHERSPQSYANDRYFFAKSGQLYLIVIDHIGDKEDWDLYNHFLKSITFEK